MNPRTNRETPETMFNFRLSLEEADIVESIVERAVSIAASAGWTYQRLEARMDIIVCHKYGCRMNLKALMNADDLQFSHDVFGIRRHLNRTTGRLDAIHGYKGEFVPRFAAK